MRATPHAVVNRRVAAGSSIEPFILGIEFGANDDEHSHPTHRTVTRAWPDHHTHARCDVDQFLVQLHLCAGFAFEEIVHFSESLVVVQARVVRDFSYVQSAGEIVDLLEGSPCHAAWTLDGTQLSEINKFVAGMRFGIRQRGGVGHCGRFWGLRVG